MHPSQYLASTLHARPRAANFAAGQGHELLFAPWAFNIGRFLGRSSLILNLNGAPKPIRRGGALKRPANFQWASQRFPAQKPAELKNQNLILNVTPWVHDAKNFGKPHARTSSESCCTRHLPLHVAASTRRLHLAFRKPPEAKKNHVTCVTLPLGLVLRGAGGLFGLRKGPPLLLQMRQRKALALALTSAFAS